MLTHGQLCCMLRNSLGLWTKSIRHRTSIAYIFLHMHLYYIHVYKYELYFSYFYRFFLHCNIVFGIYIIIVDSFIYNQRKTIMN